MVDFLRTKSVRAAKAHRCEQCHKPIEVGTLHTYCACKHEGEFYAYREHDDCRAAWVALNNERDLGLDDEWCLLKDDEIEPEEREWLRGVYPAVAERLWGGHD